jgi:hypothetical protein
VMGILAVKVLAIWCLVALVIGLAWGAVIRKGGQIRDHVNKCLNG